jgi:hypothetical protein
MFSIWITSWCTFNKNSTSHSLFSKFAWTIVNAFFIIYVIYFISVALIFSIAITFTINCVAASAMIWIWASIIIIINYSKYIIIFLISWTFLKTFLIIRIWNELKTSRTFVKTIFFSSENIFFYKFLSIAIITTLIYCITITTWLSTRFFYILSRITKFTASISWNNNIIIFRTYWSTFFICYIFNKRFRIYTTILANNMSIDIFDNIISAYFTFTSILAISFRAFNNSTFSIVIYNMIVRTFL